MYFRQEYTIFLARSAQNLNCFTKLRVQTIEIYTYFASSYFESAVIL